MQRDGRREGEAKRRATRDRRSTKGDAKGERRRATGRGQGSARAEGYKQPPVLRMSNGKRSHTGAAFRRPHFGGNLIQGVIFPGFHFPYPSFAAAAGLLGEFCWPHKATNNPYSSGPAVAPRCVGRCLPAKSPLTLPRHRCSLPGPFPGRSRRR
jgi:hypothetical protein